MVDTTGITNDPSTWAVDWTKPIEWDDGTPAQNHGQPWCGQVNVEVDPTNLPQGMLKSAPQPYLIRSAHDGKGAVYGWQVNICAPYGTMMKFASTCRIVNTHTRIEAEAMEAQPLYGTF